MSRIFTSLDAYALGASPVNVSSGIIPLGDATGFNLQVITTGTLVASIALKSSNDGVHFDAVADVSIPDTASAGSQSTDISNLNAPYYRLDVARGSGSGNLTLVVSIKGNI